MDENIYKQIIQKQNELIYLMIQSGLGADIPTQIVPSGVHANSDTITAPTDISIKTDIPFDKQGFTNHLKSKGYSENCIDTYVRGVELFYQKYKVMNIETLSRYENEINANCKARTVNIRMCGMNAYFKYKGFTEYTFKKLKIQQKSFCDNIINESQYNTLIEWARTNNPKAWLIAKVIGSTGVRVSELIELKTKDLDKGYTDIIGKGNKQRRIYFPEKLVEEIKDKCGDVYIVENHCGEKISTRGISSILLKAGEKAGIPKEVLHPHSFRHFFAKQFLKKKNDISLLGDILGHSDMSTTAIYTRMTSEEQQNEINKLINW